MHTVIETEVFQDQVEAVGMSEAELDALILYISENPRAGVAMAGTGGARKLRWAGKGKGKSGGYRVITFFSGEDIPVFLLDIYAKNDKDNLTRAEQNELKQVLQELVDAYRS